MPKNKPRGFSLPPMPPVVKAAMKEDISGYRTESTIGDTDLDFEGWLRSSRPQRYQIYRQLMGSK